MEANQRMFRTVSMVEWCIVKEKGFVWWPRWGGDVTWLERKISLNESFHNPS